LVRAEQSKKQQQEEEGNRIESNFHARLKASRFQFNNKNMQQVPNVDP